MGRYINLLFYTARTCFFNMEELYENISLVISALSLLSAERFTAVVWDCAFLVERTVLMHRARDELTVRDLRCNTYWTDSYMSKQITYSHLSNRYSHVSDFSTRKWGQILPHDRQLIFIHGIFRKASLEH